MASGGGFGDVILQIVAIIVGALCYRLGFSLLKKKRIIQNTPTSKIRSLAMGKVEVNGEVVPAKEELLKSPLSGKDCVYYHYTIEKQVKRGKISSWELLARGGNKTDFYIKDDTGKVLINPSGADIQLKESFSFDCSFFDCFRRTPLAVKQLFVKHNLTSYDNFFGKFNGLRVLEYVIEPKARLYIMGTAEDNPSVEEATAQDGISDIIITTSKSGDPYVISDSPEKKIISNYRYYIFFAFFVGTVFIFFALSGLLSILFDI
ncbi:MAG TPA: GIDE domain-containing protein [Candidatus Nanoarchaeia archaeon]|nr:GIDE domain-containing protein [Candidatus Nanoarchaeia archaeon]